MTGAIYDRGYRPYEGAVGGRASARSALFRTSVRRAMGWRRSWRQKVAPLGLLAVVTVPAIVNVGIVYITGGDFENQISIITYREYVGVSSALLLFVALTAPDIMCPDRRQRVLPLIFARPLTGADYVIAKVAAMTALVFGFSLIPQVVLFLGQMLVSADGALRYARENAEVLWQVPVAIAALSLFYAAIGVAISSLTGRRIIAGACIGGLFLITAAVSGILVANSSTILTREVPPEQMFRDDVDRLPLAGEPGSNENPFVERFAAYDPTPAPLVNLATLPLVVRDLVFLGQVEERTPLSGVDNGGLYAIVVYLAIVSGSFTILFLRYREVDQ
ncbi:MAG: hypothetical protein EXQ71_08345 [Acidimicrobiia bacterium]|nr:hypothetical protein [Acidimicrobiia bacterium]